MLNKKPKSSFITFIKRSAAVLFAVEAVAFAGSYYIWYKTNRDRNFRLYLKDNYPFILESYYKTGEFIDPQNSIRSVDEAYWQAQKR